MCINAPQVTDSLISVSTLGLHWHTQRVNRCISPVSTHAAETCCSYSLTRRLLIPLQARKKEERFVNKTLFFGLCKMCLWVFLQSEQYNHFILYEGQLPRAGEEGRQILLTVCSMSMEYVRCTAYHYHKYTSLSVYREKGTSNQTFCLISKACLLSKRKGLHNSKYFFNLCPFS